MLPNASYVWRKRSVSSGGLRVTKRVALILALSKRTMSIPAMITRNLIATDLEHPENKASMDLKNSSSPLG